MSEVSNAPVAKIKRARRWSSVWVVPVIAAIIATWLVWQHYVSQGTQVVVKWETASGIVEGRTEVQCRSVRVGFVEEVKISSDLKSVMVTLRMDAGSDLLLTSDTRFWVVRPRVSAADISGLGTLITGSYIELDPGEAKTEKGAVKLFEGLEAPPVTKSSVPGLRLSLIAEESSALSVGSPIYYRDFEVGRVELKTFDVENHQVRFDIFIHAEYANLVVEGVAFWNASGLSFNAGANGFVFNSPSLTSMLTGGVSFDLPEGARAGKPVKDKTNFKLHPNRVAADRSIFNPDTLCLLYFDQSVRGLQAGAPVEFRGIRFGIVKEISLQFANPGDSRVPVIIAVEPSILKNSAQTLEAENELLVTSVRKGLRAKLSSSSLLTGALFVDFDYVHDASPAEVELVGGYYVIPTQPSGLIQLEAKLNAILTKIEALNLEELVANYSALASDISNTAKEAQVALKSVNEFIESQETQAIPKELNQTLARMQQSVDSFGPSGPLQGDLRRTLDELRASLRAFKTLSNSIEEKPNSLIFGRDGQRGAEPKARRGKR